MTSELMKESIRFYIGADYLIVNNLLWGNSINLEKGIEAVHRNNMGIIREATEMTPAVRWGVSAADGQKLLDAYKRRTPDEITDATKAEIIKTAITDIHNICGSMRPADDELLLYRNVAEAYAIKDPAVGGTVDIKGITSATTTGQKIDYGKGDFQITFHKYEIRVPKGMPILALENDYRNENEVILPPMRYRITGIRAGEDGKVIELEAIKPLDVGLLIKDAEGQLAALWGENNDLRK
jgi:hypothetical protein